MKKLIILSIFLYLVLSLKAQERVSISYDFSPILSNRLLRTNADTLIKLYKNTEDYISGRNGTDKSLFGIKTSINLFYELNNKITLSTGLSYLYQRISQSASVPPYHYNISGYNGELIYIGTKFYSLDNSEYHYLSIPIAMQYHLLSYNIYSLSLSTGMSFDYLLNNKTFDTQNLNKENGDLEINNITSELNLGLIFGYKLNDNIELYFKPDFNIFIKPNIIEYSVINQYNYYYAFGFGIKYNLNKSKSH